MKTYKVLVKGKSCHGGSMEWPLPVKTGSRWKPGAWVTHDKPCVICQSGLHVTTAPFRWYKIDCDVYEAEIGEVFGREKDKLVTNKTRLIRPVEHPKWWTDTLAFINSIKTVAWFSNGELGENPKIKMFPARAAAGYAARAAARAAAGAAAGDAAWAAAGDAARAAAWDAARYAARAAAWAAAGAAARDAAGDAAWAAMMHLTSDLNIAKKHHDHMTLRWSVWEAGYGVACDIGGVLYCYRKP